MTMGTVRIKRAMDKLEAAERALFDTVVAEAADGMKLDDIAATLKIAGGKSGASQWIRYRRNKYADSHKASSPDITEGER